MGCLRVGCVVCVTRAEGDDLAALELALSPISDVIRVSCVYHCVSHWYHDHVNDSFGLIHVSQYIKRVSRCITTPLLRAVSMSHVIQCITTYTLSITMYHDVSRALGRGPRIEPGDTMYHDCITMYHETLGGDPVSNRVIQCITTYHDCITCDTCITDRDTS